MPKVLCKILKTFPFSEDGIAVKTAEKDGTIGIPEHLVEGLKDAGYLERAEGKPGEKPSKKDDFHDPEEPKGTEEPKKPSTKKRQATG